MALSPVCVLRLASHSILGGRRGWAGVTDYRNQSCGCEFVRGLRALGVTGPAGGFRRAQMRAGSGPVGRSDGAGALAGVWGGPTAGDFSFGRKGKGAGVGGGRRPAGRAGGAGCYPCKSLEK